MANVGRLGLQDGNLAIVISATTPHEKPIRLPCRRTLTTREARRAGYRRRLSFSKYCTAVTQHTYDRYAMVDLEDPDLALFPGAANVRGEVVVMQPGDVLYIPR